MRLFVTYDAGESFVEVPDGYEKSAASQMEDTMNAWKMVVI